MSENVQVKKGSSKLVIVLAVVIVVLVGGIVAAAVLLTRNSNKDTGDGDEEPAVTIGYENNGVVALSEDELRKLIEEMERQAEEGMIDLTYKNVAYSTDGVNFECKLGNPISNRYDMYLNIYLGTDDTENQILLTGLIPPGAEMNTFKSEIPLENGEYESTLVFTQVEDDHATICGQAMVVLRLLVSDEYEYEFDDDEFDE